MARLNGGISGRLNTSTKENASGIWSLPEVQLARSNNVWPDLFSGSALRLDFNETTTLDSRISFTRATNGTYFDSAGVLRTAGSGVARFDHRLEGGVWVNKGLLIEEQRTNLALQSEAFTNASYWFLIRGTSSADQETAPDGTTTADEFIESTDTGQHGFNVFGGIVQSASTSSNYTFSCFVKDQGRGYCYVQLNFQNSGSFVNGAAAIGEFSSSTITTTTTLGSGTLPTNISGTMTDVGNGWFRITVSATSPSTGINQVRPVVGPASGSSTFSYTGDVTKGVYVWGAQLEAGAFPTSYIKTTTASVTRNADVASMTSTNFSSWFNASEGTIFSQGDTARPSTDTTATSNRFYDIRDGTPGGEAERFLNILATNGGITGAFLVIDNSVIQASIPSPDPNVPVVANKIYKTASAYKLNDFAHTLDGNVVGVDTTGTLPTVNTAFLGSSAGDLGFLNGHIAKFYYWNTRRPNEFLQSITE